MARHNVGMTKDRNILSSAVDDGPPSLRELLDNATTSRTRVNVISARDPRCELRAGKLQPYISWECTHNSFNDEL